MRTELATIEAYDAGTHTATIALLSAPGAAIASVRCIDQIAAAEMTPGKIGIVVWSDAFGPTITGTVTP